MKAVVTKKVTLTLEAGTVIEFDESQLSSLKRFVEVIEEKTKKKKKGE